MRIRQALTDGYSAIRYVLFHRPDGPNTRHGEIVVTLAETVRGVKRDDVTLMAAGVAYYAVLSLFPLSLLLLGILRRFTDSRDARENLENFFSAYLPDSVGFVDQLSAQGAATSGLLGVIGAFGLLWGGTAMLSALNRAINRAFDVSTDRPFYREKPLTIALGIAVLAVFGVSLAGSAAIESVSRFSVPVIGELAWVQVFARLFPFTLTVVTFFLVYGVLPNARTTWRAVLPGAVLAAVAFELAKVGFLVYVNRVASFEIYGNMTLLVILLVWSYVSALIVLIGAELVSVRTRMNDPVIDIAA